MTSARIVNAVRSWGHEVLLSRDLPTPADAQIDWIVINLGSRSMDGLKLLQNARHDFPQAEVAGFCGHLEVEIRRAAKAAGIHHLLTNEKVVEQLKDLIQKPSA
jgi:CheY-like chemotaxis protein